MRIGIDGRELSGHPTGVGRYLSSLCERWASLPAAAGHNIVVYSPERLGSPPTNLTESPTGAHTIYRVLPGTAGTWWEQTTLADAANADHLDVFLGPGYSLPLRLTPPGVVTLHDISFIAHPEWFRRIEGFRRRWLTRRAVAIAETIITVSEFCRQELVRYLNLDPTRVRVVPNGVSAPFAGSDGSPNNPLVLYVGSLFNRRHLPTLITAFAKVVRRMPTAELIIIGPDRTHPHQDLASLATTEGVGERVTFRGYVADAELGTLYRRASVFAFLSEYEGFGMTPLEALAAGVPAVVGDTPVAREVYRSAARYVPVSDANMVATALLEVMTDKSIRQRLLSNAAPVLEQLTWSRTALATLDVLLTAAELHQ